MTAITTQGTIDSVARGRRADDGIGVRLHEGVVPSIFSTRSGGPTSVELAREASRSAVALALLGMTSALLGAMLLLVGLGSTTAAETKDLLTVIFTPLVGLLGAATGFYFGGVPSRSD